MKYLTEDKKIYIKDNKVFTDEKFLDEEDYIYYPDYVSDFTLIQKKEILENPKVGIVLVIFSKEVKNITKQVKITNIEK